MSLFADALQKLLDENAVDLNSLPRKIKVKINQRQESIKSHNTALKRLRSEEKKQEKNEAFKEDIALFEEDIIEDVILYFDKINEKKNAEEAERLKIEAENKAKEDAKIAEADKAKAEADKLKAEEAERLAKESEAKKKKEFSFFNWF